MNFKIKMIFQNKTNNNDVKNEFFSFFSIDIKLTVNTSAQNKNKYINPALSPLKELSSNILQCLTLLFFRFGNFENLRIIKINFIVLKIDLFKK